MGLYDRDYTRYNYRPPHHSSGVFPQLTEYVKILIIINVVAFVLDVATHSRLTANCALVSEQFAKMINLPAASVFAQPWRLITFQFMHSSTGHIFMNMLGLYFLGTHFERQWGSKKFLIFYLACGLVGGLTFLLLQATGVVSGGFLVGASGGVLGLLAAAAILFPQFVVFIYFFPVPIRTAAIVIGIGYLFNILQGGPNAGGDACHIGGMAAAAAYCYWPKFKRSDFFRSFASNTQDFTKHSSMSHSNTVDQAEIDQILKKIHEHGIHSLTQEERNKLKKATNSGK